MNMPRNYFTDEQIEILRSNKYVEKVTKANVVFTEEFKNEFYVIYKSGKTPSVIFSSFGIDPKVLGEIRIKSFSRRIRDNSNRPEGFKRKANSSKGKPRKQVTPSFESETERADYYKEYAMRLEQELDLLKKVKALEEQYQRPSRAKSSK